MAFSAQHIRTLLIACLSVVPGLIGVGAQAQSRRATSEPERYLLTLGLDASHLRVAAGGKASVTLLKTQDSRDVAVAGIIGVRVPRDIALARILDDPAFLATHGGRFGAFGDPPAAADVRDVAFDKSEYRGLRKCRPGDCDFKLSAADMEAFAHEVSWSAPNAKAQADERLRHGLLRLVADYQRSGNAALPTYNDGGGVRASDAFDALLAQSHDLSGYAPELFRYLATYPTGRPDGARDFVYWSEDRLPRMRPTLTVNHVVTYLPPTGTAFVAKKQLYASHYFEGGLELLALVDAGVPFSAAGAAPNMYLITVRRFRFDYLPTGFFNIRGRVRSHMVDATRADLARARVAIEKPLTSGGERVLPQGPRPADRLVQRH